MSIVITGGEYKGRRLSTDTRSQVIRPTSGKVREALFSSLGDRVPGCEFVDLYAGSGAVGLEALSRGASRVHLVESHPQSWALLKANAQVLSQGKAPPAPGSLQLVRSDAATFCRSMAGQGRVFDVLFADPPFDRDRDFAALPALLKDILAPEGVAVIQFPTRTPPAWADQAGKIKRYGESGLAFFRGEGIPGGPGSIF
jgi:16S rRNA (guanine(966)-N(2))-methyltransferase RsmD